MNHRRSTSIVLAKIAFFGLAYYTDLFLNNFQCKEIEELHGKRPPAYVAFDAEVNCNVWCVCAVETKEWVIVLT